MATKKTPMGAFSKEKSTPAASRQKKVDPPASWATAHAGTPDRYGRIGKATSSITARLHPDLRSEANKRARRSDPETTVGAVIRAALEAWVAAEHGDVGDEITFAVPHDPRTKSDETKS